MTEEALQGKVYYNVTIDHNPDDPECEKNFMHGSVARTDIKMKEPLIDSPEEYTLSISKFKIDTSGLPFMIPEMRQPQPSRLNAAGVLAPYPYTNGMISTMGIKLRYQGAANGQAAQNNTIIDTEEYPVVFYPEERKVAGGVPYDFTPLQEIEYLETQDNVNKLYINNTSPQCYVYSLSSFLNYVNLAINRAYNRLITNVNVNWVEMAHCPGFAADGENLFFYHYIPKINQYSTISVGLTANLFHYLDIGFPTIYRDGYYWIDTSYYNYINGAQPDPISNVKSLTWNTTNVTFNGVPFTCETYSKIISPYMRWGDVKNLLITSDQLSVAGEFIPSFEDDGFLNHTKTPLMVQAYKDVYGTTEIGDGGVFERAEEKIVEVFYPITSTIGDIRTQVIFNNQDIENGNKIDLIPGGSIQQFDINVKWMDIFGNIHPLYLPYGCNIDIRFVFSRKRMTKEEIVEGMGMIMKLLKSISPSKEESEEERIDRLKKKRVRLNNELIPMFGQEMNKYGFIDN